MSRSAGPGSPLTARCRGCCYPLRARAKRTGRTRLYRAKWGSALGVRSDLTAREFVCSCGHVGWSAHVDAKHLGFAEGAP